MATTTLLTNASAGTASSAVAGDGAEHVLTVYTSGNTAVGGCMVDIQVAVGASVSNEYEWCHWTTVNAGQSIRILLPTNTLVRAVARAGDHINCKYN